MKNFLSVQFVRFLFTGGLAAIANIVSRILFSNFFDYRIAVTLAFFVGLSIAFLLSRFLVFPNARIGTIKSFYRFVLVNLLALVQVWIVSVVLAEYIFKILGFDIYPELIAHVIGVSIPVVTSFFAHKYFTFPEGKAGVPHDGY